MRSLAVLVVTAATATAGVALLTGPAAAAPAGTPITFTITSTGGLSVTEPVGPAALGPVAQGATLTGSLGTTTVTDSRIAQASGWTDSITGPASFSTSGAATLPDGAFTVFVPAGGVTFSPAGAVRTDTHTLASFGVVLSAAAQALVTATDALPTASYTGTFTPQLQLMVPANAAAADYSGTVTQTVS